MLRGQISAEYSYKPLGNARDTRLLLLLGSYDDEEITCDLRTVSLTDPPSYGALSYVWGDPVATHPLRCGNIILNIPTNLYSALRHLHQEGQGNRPSPLLFWANAICMERLFLLANRTADWDLGINQDDANEKIEQIQMMTDIYRCAASRSFGSVRKPMKSKSPFHTCCLVDVCFLSQSHQSGMVQTKKQFRRGLRTKWTPTGLKDFSAMSLIGSR